MHQEILNKNQADLLPLIHDFANDFYLAGGTAIALKIGHRRSLDFDLFTEGELKKTNINQTILTKGYQPELIYEESDQLHLLVNEVKLTFLHYPYETQEREFVGDIIETPSLEILAAMKAFTLGKRAKWKDYIDLYFLLRDHLEIQEIVEKANDIYKGFFNKKLFFQQLSYYEDLDYSEEVEYVGEAAREQDIKAFLVELATRALP